MEWFVKYKVIIVRTIGIVMLLISFSTYFWGSPKQGLSQNERAAMNIARMESKVSGTAQSQAKSKPDMSSISQHVSDTSKKQREYLTIFAMIFGVLFIGYSFIKK